MSSTDDQKRTDVAESQTIDTLKEEEKAKLAAAEEAYSRKASASGNGTAPEQVEIEQPGQHGRNKTPWVPGVILIGLGVIFLLNNTTSFTIDNWWALFILIPAIGSFSKAADSVRSTGVFGRNAWSALAGGLILTLVASAFLFDLDWSLIWPVFLIIGGMGLFLGAWRSW